MASLFDKLNLKGRTEIVVLDAPPAFEPQLAALEGVTVRRSLDEVEAVTFALAFVTEQEQLDQTAAAVAAKAMGDAVLWFAYPKLSSKRYHSPISRDRGWETLERLGFRPVRQVAIDEDWSALRFRPAEYVKSKGRGSAAPEG